MNLFIDYILALEYKIKSKNKKKKEREEALKNGFQGNPSNPEDVLKYENLIGGKVISFYEEDGNFVQVYEDGNVVRICCTLTTFFPDIETQDKCFQFLKEIRMSEKEQWRKENLSSYLQLPSLEISKLDWCAIDNLILEKSINDGPIKQLQYKWIEKVERKKSKVRKF